MNKPLLTVLIVLSVLPAGTAPSLLQRTNIQHDLAALAKRGVICRMVDNDVVELTDPMIGEKRLKSLREPGETQIRSWAAQRGIPILEIDPNTIDTSRYTGWYNYWTTVPLGNSSGLPLIVADLNHNAQPDVYGSYKDSLSSEVHESRVYELDSLGGVHLRFQYVPWPGASSLVSDADTDSMMELDCSYNGIISGYEQSTQDSLPLHRTFEYDRYYHNSDPGPSKIYIGNLDGDSLADFLYQGTGPDPNDTNIAISKTYVAEYDPTLQGFVRVWSTQFVPGSGAAGFSVGDFDGDGKMEFVASHGLGRVFVAENTGDNQYALTWQDSTPFVNLYYHGSGDVDGDGKVEFFTGATMSDGNWVLMYEADSDNAYSAKFLFHLMSGGVFAEPIYTTVDLDGDGKVELAMMVGSDLFVFKSDADNEYHLWYYRREDRMEAIAFYDFNHDGRMDFIASKSIISSQGMLSFYADVYLATPLVEVREQRGLNVPDQTKLYANYPNPFNPQTTIEYVLAKRGKVTVRIYNLLGQCIATLVDREEETGPHSVTWRSMEASSGVYICRLEAPGVSVTRKLLLIR